MKQHKFLLSSIGLVVSVGLAGCSDDEGGSGSGGSAGTAGSSGSTGSGGSAGKAGSGGSSGSTGSGGTGGASGSAGTGASGGDSGTPTGSVRLAHLSPDAPAVDVCVDPGSGFIGPVLKGAGDTDGLAYPEVTAYLDVPAATYAVRIVAPNAADCATALGGLPDVEGVAVAEGGAYTAAAVGMLTPAGDDEAFSIEVLADVSEAANAAQGYLRFIHASPDTPAVDVGTGSGESFSAVWTDVEFPNVGQVGGGDYLETDPLDGVEVSARASGTTSDALVIPSVDLPAGAVATAFAIGNLDSDPKPLKVLICVDSAAAATCSVVP
jgi:hypothetical protein